MTFDELYEYVRVYSGNFIIPEEVMEVGKPQFHILLKNSIGWYQRYTPLLFTYNINTGGSINYTFTGYEYPKSKEWGIPLIPKKLSDVLPTLSTFMNPLTFRNIACGMSTLACLNNMPKVPFLWRYDSLNGKLYLDRGGELEVKAEYNHPIIERVQEVESETGKTTIQMVDLPSINPTDIDFLHMIAGEFMLAVAHSRSLFSTTDSPISVDFQNLQAEGTRILEAAKQSIIDNSDFYLSWG